MRGPRVRENHIHCPAPKAPVGTIDREPTCFRILSPQGYSPHSRAAWSGGRCTHRARPAAGAQHWLIPDPRSNLLFCFVASRAHGPQTVLLPAAPTQPERWT